MQESSWGPLAMMLTNHPARLGSGLLQTIARYTRTEASPLARARDPDDELDEVEVPRQLAFDLA